MDKFKKIKSKIFKSKPPKEREPEYIPSRSRRLSSDSQVFVVCGSYRPEDCFNITPEERYPDWYQHKVDPNDFTRPYFPRRPYVEKNIIDQFPAPPTTIPEKPRSPVKPKRPSVRPPTLDFSDFSPKDLPPKRPKRPSVRPPTLDFSQIPDEVLISEFPKGSKAKIGAFDAAEAARNAAQLRSRHRTQSSVSGHTSTQPLHVRPRGMSHSNAPVQPPVQPSGTIYKNHTASQSTRSLDPRARYRACLASQRQAKDAGTHSASSSGSSMYSTSSAAHSAYNLSYSGRYHAAPAPPVPSLPPQHDHEGRQARDAGTHSASSSGSSMYSTSSAAHSAYNLSHSGRYHAAPAAPHPTPPVPSLPPQHDPEGASVCRRNASSASSRSVHALRRHGMLPPPDGFQQHEVFRALRGPHAAKLQTPSAHTRANEDIGLPVNDTKSSKEWGAMSSRAIGGAATVAGYGRSAGVQRY